MDYSESFINNTPVTGIVPIHVDDGEKDVSEGGLVRYKAENISAENGSLVLKANKDGNGYTDAMI